MCHILRYRKQQFMFLRNGRSKKLQLEHYTPWGISFLKLTSQPSLSSVISLLAREFMLLNSKDTE